MVLCNIMSAQESYFKIVQGLLTEIHRTQKSKMTEAASWVLDALRGDHFIYTFGSGHSHTLAEETFYRAGGLARAIPILDEKLMVHESAVESTVWERKEGYAAEVISRYPVTSGDILFIVSNSGRNAVPIEMALEGVARGARVIAITGLRAGANVPSRHSSGKKLTDVVHLSIDNCGTAGDAAVPIDKLRQKTGPTSTITSAFILNSILVEAVEQAAAAGVPVEVWGSANSDGTNNEGMLAKYRGRIPHL